MKRFERFMNLDSESYTYLDLSEVVSVSGPWKNYPDEKWYSKGRECYYIRYLLKSGVSGIINCWCVDLASNYLKIIVRDA